MWNALVLSPGQTIVTCQRNTSQHCWGQHVECVWPPCCEVLGVVGSNMIMVKFEPTTSNISQHIATRWPNARNMLRPTLLRYVALACCDRLAGALLFHKFCKITLLLLSKWRKKRVKPGGCAHGQTKSPDLSL